MEECSLSEDVSQVDKPSFFSKFLSIFKKGNAGERTKLIEQVDDDQLKSFSINEDHFFNPRKKHVESVSEEVKRKRKRKHVSDTVLFPRKTNLFFSVFNLINDILSPGTLSMGQMISQSGLWMALVNVCFFGIITSFTLIILYELSRKHLKTSLPSLAEKAFGKPGNVATCIFIFLFNFGGACGMYIMFGDVLGDLLLYLFNDVPNMFISRTAILIYLTVFLIPVAMMKNLSSFAFTSFISVSSVLIITGMIIFELALGRRFVPYPNDAFYFAHDQYLSALGGLSFIFVCHDIVFHVFGDMKRPTRRRFYTVVFIVVGLTISTIFAIGISSYLLFWDKNLKDGNILDLLPRRYALAIIARILLLIDICLSIPYALFMPRDGIKIITEAIVPNIYKRIDSHKIRREIFHVLVTLFLVLAAMGIALSVTDLGIVSDLFGGVSASSLAYIIPPLLFLKLESFSECKQSRGGFIRGLAKFGCIFVLLIGISIFGSSIFSVIYYGFIKKEA